MIFLTKKPAAVGGGFTPTDLFGASEAGGTYDASDLSTLWQDTGGTVPVTADGQSVARWDDKSGNGNHIIQATASRRPVYKTSGGLHWLQFDGIDDYLSIASDIGLYSAGASTLAYSGAVVGSDNDYIVTAANSTNNTPVYCIARTGEASGQGDHASAIIRPNSGSIIFAGDNTNPSQRTVSVWYDDTVRVFRIEDDGSGISWFLGGTEDANSPAAYDNARSAVTVNNFTIGGWLRTSFVVPANVDVHTLTWIGRTLTAGEASDLDAFNADKAGV